MVCFFRKIQFNKRETTQQNTTERVDLTENPAHPTYIYSADVITYKYQPPLTT